MSKIDKVIQYFRNLKEEAPIMTSSPTMSSGQATLPTNNISGKGIATFDPLMNFFRRTRKRKNGEFDNRSIPPNYRKWMGNK